MNPRVQADQEAIEQLEKAASFSGNAQALALLAHAYVATGRTAEAEKLLTELKATPNSTSVAFHIAGISAELGRDDETFEWLEKCYQAHCAGMVHLKDIPTLAAVRSNPR